MELSCDAVCRHARRIDVKRCLRGWSAWGKCIRANRPLVPCLKVGLEPLAWTRQWGWSASNTSMPNCKLHFSSPSQV